MLLLRLGVHGMPCEMTQIRLSHRPIPSIRSLLHRPEDRDSHAALFRLSIRSTKGQPGERHLVNVISSILILSLLLPPMILRWFYSVPVLGLVG